MTDNNSSEDDRSLKEIETRLNELREEKEQADELGDAFGDSRRMIHPDAVDPESDFKGWLGQLMKEAGDAGVSTSTITEELRLKATQAENGVDEWVNCEGCNEEVPQSDLEPVRPGGPRSCLEPVHLCRRCRDEPSKS